jgi:antitoxin ParD1/3/4
MSTLDLRLPDAVRAYIDDQVARRGYRDVSEYFLSLVEADRLRDIRSELEAKLNEAVRSPSTPLTSQDWADIRRQGIETIRRRTGRLHRRT